VGFPFSVPTSNDGIVSEYLKRIADSCGLHESGRHQTTPVKLGYSEKVGCFALCGLAKIASAEEIERYDPIDQILTSPIIEPANAREKPG
jgi:hypothetical protein